MKNLAIFMIPKKKMDFFEVTGGFRLDSVLEGTPSRKGGPTPWRELKKSPSSLDQEGLCKAYLAVRICLYYLHLRSSRDKR
ncbi:MAG: hypothetical protein R6T98_15645 [Desulfatiglandales bacterium]